ncbi:MAG: hypothetical protein COB53_12520 [Elusimicrobia bacterium]|nr:MAG: hypothetical protein COB53_12520 [Elusimicrobiota bacterium]
MRSPGLLLISLLAVVGCARQDVPVRTVTYEETIRIPAQKDRVRLWVPVPQNEKHQAVRVLSVKTNAVHRRTQEKEFGNELLYVEGAPGKDLELNVVYEIDRKLRRGSDGPAHLSEALQERFTAARGKVEINDRIRTLADKHGGSGNASEVAKGFYSYILEFMAYDKKAPGWGEGDSLRACVVGLGNCTDFHSLFQAMATVKNIPSRFRMGLPLGPEKVQSFEGKGYHCWLDFHADGHGWIPMDISEAWKVKHGKKKMDSSWVKRYFGTIDEGRILLSSGRALMLEPPQAGPLLNYFAYPYAESGGKPLDAVSFTRIIRDRL